jgi:hypothetical protein
MGIHQIDKIASYVRFLHENPRGTGSALQGTPDRCDGFFRDPHVWQLLRDKTLPALLAATHGTAAGMGRRLLDRRGGLHARHRVQGGGGETQAREKLQAPDLRHRSRPGCDRQGAPGVFLENISADVSQEQLRRYFTKEEGGYRVRAEIREMVIFSPHSLIMDPPFTKLDILSCRNLLIYLAPEMQKKLFPLFHYSLNPGGILLSWEMRKPSAISPNCSPPSAANRGFTARIVSAVRPEPIEFPSSFAPGFVRGRIQAGGTSHISISRCRPSNWSCDVMLRRRCWSTTRETSSTSAADRQIPGTRGGQGEPQYFRHGPRWPAPRVDIRAFQKPCARPARTSCTA